MLFLKNKEIDKNLWDERITASPNGLIYAKCFYLDNMCPGWAALTGPDYEWLLPVTERKKYGVRYLFQPAFTQQLGVFVQQNVSIPHLEIVKNLQSRALFGEVSWNYATRPEAFIAPLKSAEATNYILDLSRNYKSITAGYHKSLVENIKLAGNFNHVYSNTRDYNKSIDLYKAYYGERMHKTNELDYQRFKQLCGHLDEKEMVICREVINDKNEVLTSALLLSDGGRLYNLMNTTTDAGRKSKANFFLFDNIIKEFAGKDLLLDFEGSDLPGVKYFYRNFGAVNQPFFRVRYNRLRWPLKLFKK